MNRYLVQLSFVSFVKFNSLAFCCANTLFSPLNAFFTFQNSGIGKALLVILLAPFAGLLLGIVFGALAFPLYKLLTTHSQFLASLTGTFQEIPSSSADEPARDD